MPNLMVLVFFKVQRVELELKIHLTAEQENWQQNWDARKNIFMFSSSDDF